jgi:hypothetical protein
MKYLENVGANCSNCGCLNHELQCQKCLDKDGMQGWIPTEGIKTETYEFYYGPKLKKTGYGRRVIQESEVIQNV